jgi:hypothetical protein
MPKQVFISYSTSDRQVAYEICQLLEKAGVPCWIAPRDVPHGTDWAEQIIRAIENSSVTLILLSEAANASPYVASEVERAFSRSKPIVTFRTQDVTPGDRLALFLSRRQWIDGWPPPLEVKVQALTSGIGGFLNMPAQPPKAPDTLPPNTRLQELETALRSRLEATNQREAVAIARAIFKLDPYHDLARRVLAQVVGEIIRLRCADQVRDLAFSPDGRYAVCGGAGAIQLWDLAAGVETKCLRLDAGSVERVAFSSNGDRLVSGQFDSTIRAFDVASGREISKLAVETGRVFAFSADGRLAASSGDMIVRLWNLETGAKLAAFEGHTEPVDELVFSPKGNRLYSAGRDCSIREWDLDLGIEMQCLVGATGQILSLAISPDGHYLASAGCGDGRLWDIAAGHTHRRLRDHGSALGMYGPVHHSVRGLAFSPDGRYLLSGGDDGVVLLQQVVGSEVTELKGHTGQVFSVAFSPDGRQALSAGGHNTLILWGLPTTEASCKSVAGSRQHAP